MAIETVLDGPIDSVRWENLRDGMEDYEYLWLLDQELRRVSAVRSGAPELARFRGLLEVPPEVSVDLTHFTTDSRSLLAHREKVARAIVALGAAGR